MALLGEKLIQAIDSSFDVFHQDSRNIQKLARLGDVEWDEPFTLLHYVFINSINYPL